MARHVIDLSQPLSRESQLHPFFPPTQILRHIQHADADEGRPSFAAEVIITSNHAATHVDAFGHYDPSPDAPAIAEMPLDVFFGEAVCVDVRRYPKAHDVTAGELEQAVAESGQEVRGGDIVLFCTDHYNRTAGTPAFLDGFSGVSAEAVHWMADHGIKIFGVENDQPRPRLRDRRVPDPPRLRRARHHPLREPQQPEGRRAPALRVLRLPAPAGSRLRLARASRRHPRRVIPDPPSAKGDR